MSNDRHPIDNITAKLTQIKGIACCISYGTSRGADIPEEDLYGAAWGIAEMIEDIQENLNKLTFERIDKDAAQ